MRATLVVLALVAGLAGCGDDDRTAVPGKGHQAAPAYVAGGHYDGEDYTGPAQPVAAVRVDPDVVDLQTKRVCKTRKSGKCTAWKLETKTVVTDDKDWVLILADTTEVDVDEATFRAHPVGSLYP